MATSSRRATKLKTLFLIISAIFWAKKERKIKMAAIQRHGPFVGPVVAAVGAPPTF
jgi:hypothetical protein